MSRPLTRRLQSSIKSAVGLQPWPRAEGVWPVVRRIRPGYQRTFQSTHPFNDQKISLDGYYADILDTQSHTTSDARSSVTSPPPPQKQTHATEKQEREARARVVFGSRLTGPERRRQLEASATTIAGVRIPPKPEEPDNCCMSGCVNCVWDGYRDELEEWAAANAQAQARLASQRPQKTESVTRGIGTGSGTPAHVQVSMDDDGGGSETNWDGGVDLLGKDTKMTADLFGDIPVGIREFMRTEKLLKQRHAKESSL